MQKFIEINNADHVLFNVLKIDRDDEFFSNKNFRESFIFSLQKAYKQKSAKKEVDRLIYFIVSKRKANWLIKIWRFFLKIFINNK